MASAKSQCVALVTARSCSRLSRPGGGACRLGGSAGVAGLADVGTRRAVYQALVNAKLAVTVDAESDLMFDASAVGFWATLNKAQSMDRACDAMLAVIESAGRKPFTQVELDRVKLQFAKSYEQRRWRIARGLPSVCPKAFVGDFYFINVTALRR